MAEPKESKKAKRPQDERKQLVIRGLIALVVIGVMLFVLMRWERLRREEVPEQDAEPHLVTPEAMQSGIVSPPPAASAAQSAPDVAEEEAAAEETASLPLGAGTAPEAPVTEAPPEKPKAATAEPAPAAAASARPRAVTESASSAPRLVVQAEPAPPGPTAPPGRAFAVQVGVFSNAANAEELLVRLRAAGIPAQLETRVAVGPFKTRDEALKAQAKIKELGLGKGQLVTVK